MSADSTTITVGFDQICIQAKAAFESEIPSGDQARESRPFLKWAGGKQWLSPLSAQWLPSSFDGVYYEPFLGGGSSFFSATPSAAVLSDRCDELIRTYRALRDDADAVIATLRKYPHTIEFFKEIRKRRPRTLHTEAARIIYLNKTAFNGLYRVNRNGEFNVPFGRYKNPTICNEERLRDAAAALQGVTLRTGDFEDVIAGAGHGDFAYLDPPYITGHQNNGFLKYNAPLFSWDDQLRLSETARSLRENGATVVVSNTDHDAVPSLYPGFFYNLLERASLIGGRGSHRGRVGEALLSSAPILDIPTTQIDG
jgi:DNA adenine methylase